jgi:bifunctional non-homologous end joining protein LigD
MAGTGTGHSFDPSRPMLNLIRRALIWLAFEVRLRPLNPLYSRPGAGRSAGAVAGGCPAMVDRPARNVTTRHRGAPKSSGHAAADLPDFIAPALATLVDCAPTGDEWLHEIKFDGYRTALRLDKGMPRMLTRSGLDWTTRFWPIAATATTLRARVAYIDGEVTVLDDMGVSDLGGLQEALSEGRAERLVYYAFDLLHLDGRNLMGLPLVGRKARLEKLMAGLRTGGPIRYSEHVLGHGPELFRGACEDGLEGILSKRAGTPYHLGRTTDWLKTKCTRRQEFVIGGWRRSTASARALGSLLVGFYDGDKLVYADKVGTGFTERVGREVIAKLERRRRETSPFVEVPRAEARGARWVEPVNVAEVEFSAWTRDGHIRHPSLRGLREDKAAGEVRAERPSRAS